LVRVIASEERLPAMMAIPPSTGIVIRCHRSAVGRETMSNRRASLSTPSVARKLMTIATRKSRPAGVTIHSLRRRLQYHFDDPLGRPAVPEVGATARRPPASDDVVHRRCDCASVQADQTVGALRESDRPLSVRTKREARHPQHGRLLLYATGIGQDESSPV